MKVKHKSGKRRSRRSPSPPIDEHHRNLDYDSDLDLEKELHPIGHYLDDRSAMLDEVFKVINGPKLRAMLTSVLRDVDMTELKRLCLTELEGMSKKRIRHILAGKEMLESSNTEDDEDDDEGHGTEDLFQPKKPESAPPPPSDPLPKTHKLDVQIKPRENLEEVKDMLKDKQQQEEEKKDGKSLMELLELEMRARAIKALLNKSETKLATTTTTSATTSDQKQEELPEEVEEEQEEEEGDDGLPVVDMNALAEKEKKLNKAREALMKAESKKQREEDILKQKQEALERQKKAEEDKLRKKLEEEMELERKKVKKEEDHKKFLEWKSERRKKEALKAKLEDEVEADLAIERSKRKLQEMIEGQNKAQEESDEYYNINNKEDFNQQGKSGKKYRRKGSNSSVSSRGLDEDEGREDGEYSKRSSFSSSSSSSSSYSSFSSRDEEQSDGEVEWSRNERKKRARKINDQVDDDVDDDDDEEVDLDKYDLTENLILLEEDPRLIIEGQEIVGFILSDVISKAVEISEKEKEAFNREQENNRKVKIKRGKKGATVFIKDDSDNEKILTSSSDEEESDREQPDEVKDDLEKSPKHDKDENSDGEIKDEDDEEMDEEEKKRLERQERLREERLKRMRAFQKATEIQESVESDRDDPEDEDEVQEMEAKNEGDFYKSFYEEEEKKKQKIEEEKVEEENVVEKQEEEQEQRQEEEPPVKKAKKEKREKTTEEKVFEGIGYCVQMCESQGDFEEKPPPERSPIPKPKKLDPEQEKQKREMDALDESMMTWADRWYADKKVQKVVQDSKMMSKVRKKTQVAMNNKPKKVAPEAPVKESELPKIIGSMEEYKKLTNEPPAPGQSTESGANDLKDPESDNDHDEDDDEDEDSELWGAIMGAN